ncbi:MAG: YfcE family phosphodiesterase [Firmicutes bacterium HGW-Firmicutes-14]|nr:MAG: YfcE family phosphodiesterase [Firmicutes bacterium HGW-Firmicutes-14]
MKIGIIADTHITKDLNRLKTFLEKHLSDVDMIIHAGDFKSIEVLNLLREFKSFTGIWGNNDSDEIKALLNETEIIELEGYRIGLFHGHGSRGTTIERAYSRFSDVQADVIIFGHSHQPVITTRQGVLLLNPGSPISKRKERWFSFIIMELSAAGINTRLAFVPASLI